MLAPSRARGSVATTLSDSEPLRSFSQYQAPLSALGRRKIPGRRVRRLRRAVYVAEVTVDMLTGKTRVDDFVAVQEVAR